LKNDSTDSRVALFVPFSYSETEICDKFRRNNYEKYLPWIMRQKNKIQYPHGHRNECGDKPVVSQSVIPDGVEYEQQYQRGGNSKGQDYILRTYHQPAYDKHQHSNCPKPG
ncbi:MAG: hypothetical protein IJG63_04415, partial [Oscillospiraceae bacterium]|nr:hypothetical protein [Oscillospiraceae bacterium]